MKLWKRASGAFKDRNSIWIASLSRRTADRNPDIEAAVIKATSHDESCVDYRNAQRVFAWVRMSPTYLKPVVWSISIRMDKTRSWAVALKGLMLLHGVFCCRVPAVRRIGRLPFDLSNFKDGHTNPGRTWGHNAFVRAYYAFLDRKSTLVFIHDQERKRLHGKGTRYDEEQYSMMQELVWLQKMQGLLGMLLQMKPQADQMIGNLVLEAMDCIVIEIFDVYSRICNGIAGVLVRIYSAGKVEAAMALRVLQKATVQGEQLSLFFEFCRDIGVINASECPRVEKIPEEDFQELEHIINGVSDGTCNTNNSEDQAIVVMESRTSVHERKDSMSSLQTIITDRWEVFEEDPRKVNGEDSTSASAVGMAIETREHEHPIEDFLIPTTPPVHGKNEDLPDLISFL